jgi:hypothetical protein
MNLPRFSAFKRSRWHKRLVWAAAAFLVYTLVGFFVLPPVIKWQMLKRLPDITKRQVAVRQVKFNPLALSLTIRGLALTEPNGRPFVSWEELYINFQASSLFRWAWTFKEIRLVKPFGELILFEDGRLNFANMFESPTNTAASPPPRKAGIPRVNIFYLQITNGFVALEDQTRRSPFRTQYRPINLELTQFTTRPNLDTPYSFRAESDAGRSVTWAGDLTVEPLRSQGRLEITGVKLSRYQPYLEDFTKALLTNGLADLQLEYRFEAGTNGMDLVVTNGAVHVEQMQLQDPKTGETVAGLRGFDVRQGELNWRKRTARLGAVKVSEAMVLARLQKNGRLNLLELLPPASPSTNAPLPAANSPVPPAAELPPWTVSVDDFAVQDTDVTLEDLTRRTPFRTELKPLTVSLKRFTTKADADAAYSFHIVTEAAETVEGTGTVSINPVRSAGEVRVGAVDVKKYLPYAEDFFRGRITAGKLAMAVPYHFLLFTNGPRAGVSNLTLQLTGLEIKAPGLDETVTRVAEFGLARVDASLEKGRARVGLLRISGGSLLARREQDGSLNLLGLLVPGGTNDTRVGTAASPPAQTNGWTVNIDEIALNDYTVKVEDRSLPKPATLLLDQLALNLKGLSTLSSAPVNAALSVRLNETATFDAQGVVQLAPPSADFTLGLTNLDLRPFQSWLDQFLRLGVVSGALGAHGHLRYQPHATVQPHVGFIVDLWVTNFLCTDEVAFKELARWEQLAVTGIDCSLEPTRVKVGEVQWVAPKTTLLIREDHQANLALIVKPAGASATNAAPQPARGAISTQPGAETIPVQVDLVRLDRAAFDFIDESIRPHASVGIQELSGTVKGLSSALNTTAEVDLAGRLGEQSPFGIAGRVNPLASNLFVDLVISNANTELTPLTPYFEKYVGYPLNKGRLTTLLRYHVEGKELKAENKIDIERLTLGLRNKSSDATSLPVKLAVALLKDSNGRIELDLPLHGRLDDPQFSLGPIILKVLVNVITKTAASPFKLLGALVGGGEELSFVSFVPGTTNLVEGEVDKLTKLAKALARRPALNLEIEGAIDSVADRGALAKQKLRDQFKTRRLHELAAKGKAPQSVETFQLSPDDYDQLLRAAFADKFGTNIAAILQTNQLTLAVTNQPGGTVAAKAAAKPKPPLYRRALALVGLGKHARKSTAEKHLAKADRLALEQATPELMETLIAGQIEVTDDDYRVLMSARAQWVQNWLLHSGQVADERLLLVAPKRVDAAYRGESQAILSLE